MAKGNILKKRDSDLTSGNIKPGVDIFGVEGGYLGLTIEDSPLCVGFAVYDSGGETLSYSLSGYFYDTGGSIICMGIYQLRFLTSRNNFIFYLEIDKATKTVSQLQQLQGTVGTIGTVLMKNATIGGFSRYGVKTSSGSFGYYRDGTSIVSGGYTELNGGTTVGTSTLSYLGKTLSLANSEYSYDGGNYTLGTGLVNINFS